MYTLLMRKVNRDLYSLGKVKYHLLYLTCILVTVGEGAEMKIQISFI